MACCSAAPSPLFDNNEEGYKRVPDAPEDITAAWCQWALQKRRIISLKTTVSNVHVKRLQNEETGVKDGGGMIGMMLRIKLTYSKGEGPTSMVAKLSRGGCWNMSFKLRIFAKLNPGALESSLYRTETLFFQQVIPVLERKGYQNPKVYYAAIHDAKEPGFASYVVMNPPCKVKSITIMEDMDGWKIYSVSNWTSHERIMEILRNLAILHAAFWNEKEESVKSLFKYPGKAEQDNRGGAHSWFAKKWADSSFSSVAKCQKKVAKYIADWSDDEFYLVPKENPKPNWIMVEPLEDGSLPVLKDATVVEMLNVLAQRYPAFNKNVVHPYLDLPTQTLIHGDCHIGNHMYGQGENEGKIVAFDFQMAGPGRVASELVYLYATGIFHQNLSKDLELESVYHDELVKQGVSDYSLEEFQRDAALTFVLGLIGFMLFITSMTPQKVKEIFRNLVAGDKSEDMIKFFKTGLLTNVLLRVTSMYLEDKENFLRNQNVYGPNNNNQT